MSLETIREVVSMWWTAESRRRGEWEQSGRNLRWEAILIKWTYGRTHRPISTDLLNTWHHHLSFPPSSCVFYCHYVSPFFSVFPNSVSPLIKSLFLTLLFFFSPHSRFFTPISSFPPSCLGGTVLWRNLICNFYMRNQSHTSGSIGLAIYRPGRLMQ